MGNIGVELSSSTPETWLKTSLFPQPSPLVLLPHAKLGVKATAQISPLSKTCQGITGHTNPPSSQEQPRSPAGVGADALQRIPDPRETPAPMEPSRGSAPHQPLPKIRALEIWHGEGPAPSAQPAAARALLDTQTPLPGAEIFRKEGQCRHFFLNSQEFPPERCKRRAEKNPLPCAA